MATKAEIKEKREMVAYALKQSAAGFSDAEIAADPRVNKCVETVRRWRRNAKKGGLRVRSAGRPKAEVTPGQHMLVVTISENAFASLKELAKGKKRTIREQLESMIAEAAK